jgi:N4-gp56 family major capsid protein
VASTIYGVNSPETVKLWRKKLAREAIKATSIQKFIGEADESLIQLFDETSKGAGDRVTVQLRSQMQGLGVQGDGTLEGNEESLQTYTDNLVVDQLRHAVRSAGKMSEQRIPWKHREEAMMGLKDWWAARLDNWFFNQICGYTAVSDTRLTGLQSTVAPDAAHQIWAGGVANDQSLTSTNIFTLSLIDSAVAQAKTLSPVLRPVKINGGSFYVMFLHPYQVLSLRTNTSTGQWLDIQKAAMTGDGSADNPILTGALGVYNNVILHESFRVSSGVNSSTGAGVSTTRRAVMCGAQAAALGFGQDYSFDNFSWNEELFDYGNQLGVEAGVIGGLKKLRFNSADFSTIVVSTYSNASDSTASTGNLI